MYQSSAPDIDALSRACLSTPPEVCLLNIDLCILGKHGDKRRIHMMHWPYDLARGMYYLNVPATRILVERNLLEPPTPVHSKVQAGIFDECPHGPVVFFAIGANDELLDYPFTELQRDWSSFFVNGHPSSCGRTRTPANPMPGKVKVEDSFPSTPELLVTAYPLLADKKVTEQIATRVLCERFSGTISQRQRVESTIIGHAIFRACPDTWRFANDLIRGGFVIYPMVNSISTTGLK